jgi:hypothetical protein
MSQPAPSPAVEPPASSTASAVRTGLASARALVESAVLAVAASALLYLVGFVYVDAYYGRMSIDAASLDLPTSLVALHSLHAANSIVSYPIFLALLAMVYRWLHRGGRLADWYQRAAQRLGRLLPAVENVIVVVPLVSLAIVEAQRSSGVKGSVLGEVSELFEEAVILLVLYAVWRGLRGGCSLLVELRERKVVPVVLLFGTYLLSTLVGTAHIAVLKAETLMTGLAEGSLEIRFAMRGGGAPVGGGVDLILVATRPNGFYVVERQPVPPSGRPLAYVVPLDAVQSASIRRLNEASSFLDEMEYEDSAPGGE